MPWPSVVHVFDRLSGLFAKAMATGAAPAATPTAAPAAAGEPVDATLDTTRLPAAEPVDAAELSARQLVARALAWERMQRAVSAAQLVDLAAFATLQHAADNDARIGCRLSGRTVNPEVAINLGISTTAAASRVGFARSVVDEHAALLRCLADGLVSEWHLRMVVAATEDLTPAHKDLVARQLAVRIRARHTRGTIELTPYKLAHAAARLVIAVDPDAATRRCERARRRREVSVTARRDGACALGG